MCQAAVNLTSKALNDVTDAEVLLKIKGFISLFIQTMEVILAQSLYYDFYWSPKYVKADRVSCVLTAV